MVLFARGVPGEAPYLVSTVAFGGENDSLVQAPATPTNVVIAQRTSHSFLVTWTGSPGASRYDIRVTGAAGVTTYSIPTRVVRPEQVKVDFFEVPADRTHQVTVTAANSAGESAPTASVTARTARPAAVPPAPVRKLSVRVIFDEWLEVTWVRPRGATDEYVVHWTRDGHTSSSLVDEPVFVARVNNPAGEHHSFQITARNSAGDSPISKPVDITL